MEKGKFCNKEVEITIERDGDNFELSSSDDSPLMAYGTIDEVMKYFQKITLNTIESMKLNQSKKITIHASWE